MPGFDPKLYILRVVITTMYLEETDHTESHYYMLSKYAQNVKQTPKLLPLNQMMSRVSMILRSTMVITHVGSKVETCVQDKSRLTSNV